MGLAGMGKQEEIRVQIPNRVWCQDSLEFERSQSNIFVSLIFIVIVVTIRDEIVRDEIHLLFRT